MTTIREAIRDSNRLARMRMGQAAWEPITFPTMSDASGDPIRFAQVPLTEAETQQGVMLAAGLDVQENMAGYTARNRAAQVSDVWHSLRDPHDLSQKAFESIEEMVAELEPTDIDLAVDGLSILMDYASPSIDGLSDEVLDDLKVAFAETDWSALSGRRWAAVKLCCQHLLPELLQAKLSGSTSTESSTTRTDDTEST